ncbi:Protein-tyrosine phosphatase [Dictyocaulus viviparus]|uniref:Protein-tyrosine phosphatase n=1 Tax=Dictyocaulus viviparus TaxID=29172 RepID=A0A0D8XT11_DICVI|nr:Protein-tyrosine phosphatase [Dictyocaulus viviparus]
MSLFRNTNLFQAVNTKDRSLKVLSEFVERISAKKVDGIVKEYKRLDNFYDVTATYEAFKSNMVKNRYSDVVCIDSTRVKLELGEKDFGDYIHANYVSFPLLTTKFICTQGPLQSTIHDFWRMIFQERIESVLMLCNWPDRGVPDHNSCLIPLQLLDRIRHAPCVVHCSAGIGRTGSIIALEIALQDVVAGNTIDFERIARELRCARAQCIQTQVQYLYIHRVMIENALMHINLDESTKATGKKFLQDYDSKLQKGVLCCQIPTFSYVVYFAILKMN